jgi:predicted membrane protein
VSVHCAAADNHRLSSLPSARVLTVIQRIFSTLLRLLVITVGVVFGALLLAAGLVFTLLLLVWSLLRGRRPRVVKFRVNPGFDVPRGRGEVVDIEAREVPDAPPQLKRKD